MIDFGIGRNVNNDDYKGLPDGTLDSSIQELTFSVSLYKTRDIMGLNTFFDGMLARKNYELNHLDKSSPIISVSLSNYLVDVETGSFESFGPMADIGHPLKCEVSFFKQSAEGKNAPAEIIEIKQEKTTNPKVNRFIATYLSKNGQRLSDVGISADADLEIRELDITPEKHHTWQGIGQYGDVEL